MQLIEVPAKTGYVWFRQGIWLFRKNPLAFLTLFFTYLLVMTLAAQIPVVGGVLPLALTVALTALELLVAFLQAYVFAILTCIYLNDAIHPGH